MASCTLWRLSTAWNDTFGPRLENETGYWARYMDYGDYSGYVDPGYTNGDGYSYANGYGYDGYADQSHRSRCCQASVA